MTAREAAFTRLIDYAGLYPPAALDMGSAVRNYLAYAGQPHAWMLGCFIVDVARLDEVRDVAGDSLAKLPLSVIAPVDIDTRLLVRRRDDGFRIESVEMKCEEPLKITRMCETLPPQMECYIEIPVRAGCSAAVDAMAAVDLRAKLRMGGVVPEAFPGANDVSERLHLLADRKVAFKATAGLHHPLRSLRRLTYAADSPTARMHGFVNLLCAAAATHFGGPADDAMRVLEEEDPGAFQIGRDSIAVHGHSWTTAELREVRKFFVSFGSCSFTEPTSDLKELGWL